MLALLVVSMCDKLVLSMMLNLAVLERKSLTAAKGITAARRSFVSSLGPGHIFVGSKKR
jgi:hypothetical protein